MTWGYTAVAGATLVSGYMGSQAQKKAGEAQAGAAEAGVAETRRQFDLMQTLLAPYAEGGEEALAAQQALLGLGEPGAQTQAIQQLQQSPQFQAITQQGEEAILQNAAATGGVRGGNVQAALAQFRPQLLSQLIQQQFQNLGGLTSLGESAAAMTGNAGMQTGANIANLLTNAGTANAASRLGAAQTQGETIGNLAGLFAAYQNDPNIPASKKF